MTVQKMLQNEILKELLVHYSTLLAEGTDRAAAEEAAHKVCTVLCATITPDVVERLAQRAETDKVFPF